ncbi:ribosome silencing factor [Xylophilus sp. Kf1]|nr:ribosome silencing factor [Xylophilus sp. Kf1]
MTTTPKTETAAKKDVQKLQRAIVDGLEDVKAQDIRVFNTEHLSPLFERVIIASGTSNRQTKALAMSVRDAVREAGFDKPRMEGEDNGEWIIVDCGACVVHVMQPAIRQYYHLEELWGDTPVRLKGPSGKSADAAKVAKEALAEALAAQPKVRKAAAKKATGDVKPGTAKAAAAAGPARKGAKPQAEEVAARMPGRTRAPARKAAAPADAAPATPVKKTPARKAPAKTTAAKASATSAAAPATKTAAKTPATKTPAAKPRIKTVVVGAPAKKTVAAAGKPADSRSLARKAPARKTSR